MKISFKNNAISNYFNTRDKNPNNHIKLPKNYIPIIDIMGNDYTNAIMSTNNKKRNPKLI